MMFKTIQRKHSNSFKNKYNFVFKQDVRKNRYDISSKSAISNDIIKINKLRILENVSINCSMQMKR